MKPLNWDRCVTSSLQFDHNLFPSRTKTWENISNQTRANKLVAFGGGLPAGYSHRVYVEFWGLACFAGTTQHFTVWLPPPLVSTREFPRCLNSSGVRRHVGCLLPCSSNYHGGRGHQETLLTLAKPVLEGRGGTMTHDSRSGVHGADVGFYELNGLLARLSVWSAANFPGAR